MFPEDLHAFVLEAVAEELDRSPAPTAHPMKCDPWIARSAFQKAIRRGEVELAQNALTTLLMNGGRGVWRTLVIIALEDLGVAGMDIVARVVAAARDRSWREAHGGDWKIAAVLTQQMTEADHDQAACDLLMRAANAPGLEEMRANALDAGVLLLVSTLQDRNADLTTRAIAALALGGELAPGQRFREPAAVFHALDVGGRSPHVMATCHAAWRVSRNPMALLLPMVWESWMASERGPVRDDDFRPTELIGGVPNVAVDQFTRAGGGVIRDLIRSDQQLRSILREAGVPPSDWSRTVGDALFVVEGGLVTRRAIWATGDELRLPTRPLQGCLALGDHLPAVMARVRTQAPLIAELRRASLSPAVRT